MRPRDRLHLDLLVPGPDDLLRIGPPLAGPGSRHLRSLGADRGGHRRQRAFAELHPQDAARAGTGVAVGRHAARQAGPARDPGGPGIRRLRDPRPVRGRLRARLRRALPLPAPHRRARARGDRRRSGADVVSATSKRAFYVGVSGNIGAGKTRLTQVLSERLGWEAFYEPVVDNPYLEDFYADMGRYSFHLQVFFLSERFKAMQRCLAAEAPLLQDRTLYEDGEIFAPTLHELGMLSARDYANYRALYETLLTTVPPPDRILHLSAPPEVLLERIRARDRAY
ncbi:MAG: hypothetical protein GF328_15795, partial [Candidatus Latescibacteria bacterium]|nr:hypothetical protein [Candidatus Latescibacterota bacterium]